MTSIVTADDLVEAIRKLRPTWPEQIIRDNLNQAALTRSGTQLVIDALHAAADESVRGPGAIPAHKFVLAATACGKCEARDKARADAQTRPETEWCKCGAHLPGVTDHDCADRRADTPKPARERLMATIRKGTHT